MIIRKEDGRCLTFGEDLADVERWLTSAPRTWTSRGSTDNGATHSWAAIDQIESAGRRVDLIVAMMAQQGNLRNVIGWQVKQADDHADLAAIAFSIAHPASLRRIGFAMYERTKSPTWMGYGQPGKMTAEDLPDAMPNVLCLSGLTSNFGACRTLDAAIMFVRDEINAAADEELVTVEG
jgi:hypothetical protein